MAAHSTSSRATARLDPGRLAAAARLIREADALLITAGAGMGVDSGLPDFRGTDGFWRAYPAVAQLGLSFEELANPTWFERNPALAWAFYGHRLQLYRSTEPHPGFRILLDWARAKSAGWFVFTSNVDGHFQKAGFDPARVVDCHGSIHHFQCRVPCTRSTWDASGEVVTLHETEFRALPPLPACPSCRQIARPNILLFGDAGWIAERTHPQEAALLQWLQELSTPTAGSRAKPNLVILELGAGNAIPTVRLTSEAIARRVGGSLIRINTQDPQVPPPHLGLASGARQALEELLQAMPA